ncbi:MAG: hypothetical protein OXU20_40980 [Myxococcales bacterium]|nr:hypothetical protein [Myxococcales bacterium]MDD9970981.1 hypothetical protein [Myxococcales bacterium]
MLELLTASTLTWGVFKAARTKTWGAFAAGALVAYLLAADIAGALATDRGDQYVFSFFNQLFLGPGAGPLRAAAALPLPSALQEQPLLARLFRVTICGLVAHRYLVLANGQHPLLAQSQAREATALRFAAVGILDAIEGVLLILAWALFANAVG